MNTVGIAAADLSGHASSVPWFLALTLPLGLDSLQLGGSREGLSRCPLPILKSDAFPLDVWGHSPLVFVEVIYFATIYYVRRFVYPVWSQHDTDK